MRSTMLSWFTIWMLWYIVMLPAAVYSETEIIEDGNMTFWLKQHSNLGGRGVVWNKNGKTCGTGEYAEFWFITPRVNLETTFAEVIYEDIEAELNTQCFNEGLRSYFPCYSNKFEVYAYHGKDQISEGNILNIFPQSLYNITNNTNLAKANLTRSTQTTFFFPQNNSGVRFAVRSRGACGKIFRIKMYYHVCKEKIIKSIKFERTLSPAKGFKNVTANCSENSIPSQNATSFKGYCYPNGSWKIPSDDNMECLCVEGYTLNKRDESCSSCSNTSYKRGISNDNCTECPVNTVSNVNRSSCVCKDGYYKTSSDKSELSPCHALDITTRDSPSSKVIPTATEKSTDDNNLITYIIIGVGAAMLLILIILLIICVRRRKKNGVNKKSTTQGYVNRGVELPSVGRRLYVDPSNYDDPEAAVQEFTSEIDHKMVFLERMIGGGEFGDVYKGELTTTNKKKIPIAAKTLKHEANAKSEKDFLLEASVMGQFDNPNIVRMEGVVTKTIPRMIILEFMSNGSLDNYLKTNDSLLTNLQLIGMARGVAAGMKYLAEIHFVHRDLAARNILVNENLLCKIADFGLSRELEDKDTSRGEYSTKGGKIPVRWTAPEAIKFRKFSTASDVWSYGILLWEIMTFSERPYWEWDNMKVIHEVDQGFRLPSPKDCPKGVHNLMLQCWKAEKNERPSFARITIVIDKWIRSPETMKDEIGFLSPIGEWLASIKMSSYETTFVEAGYICETDIVELTDEDLITIGITLIGHRNKIMKGINSLRDKDKKNRQSMKI